MKTIYGYLILMLLFIACNSPTNTDSDIKLASVKSVELSTENSGVIDNCAIPEALSKTIGIVGVITISGVDYDVFRGSKGGLYIFRMSSKTQQEYKAYLTEKQRCQVIWSTNL